MSRPWLVAVSLGVHLVLVAVLVWFAGLWPIQRLEASPPYPRPTQLRVPEVQPPRLVRDVYHAFPEVLCGGPRTGASLPPAVARRLEAARVVASDETRDAMGRDRRGQVSARATVCYGHSLDIDYVSLVSSTGYPALDEAMLAAVRHQQLDDKLFATDLYIDQWCSDVTLSYARTVGSARPLAPPPRL